jgi:phage replication-related protein YjqB (UPF0714/DUF867 family)
MAGILDKIIESGNLVWVMAIGVAVVAIVCGTIRRTVSSLARERTRREIAAYIAEGSMTPEQGERLMAAGKGDESCC